MGEMANEKIDKATAVLRMAIIKRAREMMTKTNDRINRALLDYDSDEEIIVGHRAFRLQMEENERWLCGELEKLQKMRNRYAQKGSN